MASSPLLRCEDVSREYRRGASRGLLPWFRNSNARYSTVHALREVSLAVDRNEVVLLSGPSGSGKSTLLHLLAALDRPTAGTVTFDGDPISTWTDRQQTAFRRDHVGIVFQDFRLLPALSARANVALPLIEHGVSKHRRRARAEALLNRVGLGDRLGHKPSELSGGERQRVAIARALIVDPDLIIADEPTGELDSKAGARILDLLLSMGTDRIVVIASHDPATAAIADRTIRLHDGRIVGGGTPNGV